MTDALLQVRDLTIDFRTPAGPVRAVDAISLDVRRGEVVGLVGETGCGKTVTALSVLGLLPPSARIVSGSISFEGRELVGQPEKELRAIRGSSIAMVFQNPTTAFNPVFSLGAQMRHVVRAHLKLQGAAADARIDETLHAVGLPETVRVRRSYPHQLSGGMLQRTMIAMALLCRPSLLIADEPTSALDVTIAAQILELLRSLQEREGFSVLLITHDLGVIRRFSDRVTVLYAGRVAETSGAPALFAAPKHPYSRGLIGAVPRANARRETLVSIPGLVPANPGSIVGCAFADRCPDVIERCRLERPQLVPVAEGHAVACHVAAAAAARSAAGTAPA